MLGSTLGRAAAAAWLGEHQIPSPSIRWHVEISLDVRDIPAPAEFDIATDTRFHIDIYSEEWGFFFCHAGRASWIRITDIPFVHGRDDYQLLAATPELSEIGTLLRRLENGHQIAFRREHALVRTNLLHATGAIQRWVYSL
jgi:hypothetical protein